MLGIKDKTWIPMTVVLKACMHAPNAYGSGDFVASSIGGPTLPCAYSRSPVVSTGLQTWDRPLVGACENWGHTTAFWASPFNAALERRFSPEDEPHWAVFPEPDYLATTEQEMAQW